ncbi:MAG: FAD-dependent oxidoreductase, partial [Pyrinomonadaceae bacterium]
GVRAVVERALAERHIEIHTGTRVVEVKPDGIVFEHNGERREERAAGVVWTAGVRVNPLVESLNAEKDRRGLLVIEPTLQLRGHKEVFALGDIADFPDVPPSLAGTAQLAFQQSSVVASNIQALIDGSVASAGHFQELGEAVSLGTEDAAVLAAGQVVGGQIARQARFALYTTRLPTWQHRLRVGASWFFGGKSPRPLGL